MIKQSGTGKLIVSKTGKKMGRYTVIDEQTKFNRMETSLNTWTTKMQRRVNSTKMVTKRHIRISNQL